MKKCSALVTASLTMALCALGLSSRPAGDDYLGERGLTPPDVDGFPGFKGVEP